MQIPTRPGYPYPLGVSLTKDGANFALFSENATAVQLLLFSHPDDKEPKEVIEVKEKRETFGTFVSLESCQDNFMLTR